VRAVAFEPDDGARRQAAANVARNGLSGQVEIRRQAVGSAVGEGALTAGLGPLNHLVARTGTLPSAPATALRRVEVVALDGAVEGPVALIKVDVEGAEAAVLDGGERLLATYRPALILEANDPQALTARLEPLGYQWVRYDPRLRRLVPGAAPSPGDNGIAVADLGAAGERLAKRERP
jgi:FkbM family methyltransferase